MSEFAAVGRQHTNANTSSTSQTASALLGDLGLSKQIKRDRATGVDTTSAVEQIEGAALQALPPEEQQSLVEKAVEDINQYLDLSKRQLLFSVDTDVSQVVVKVMDQASEEVIRQIPSELALALAKVLRDDSQEAPTTPEQPKGRLFEAEA